MAHALSIRTPPPCRRTVADEMLRQQVLDELAFDPRFQGADIAVAVSEGIATLAGAVHSNAVKQAAARAVETVAGIRAVANAIHVGSTLHGARRDTQLAAAVANSLSWNAVLGAQAVSARVERGWVILEGTVSSSCQRFEACCAVQALPGVRGVTNLIRVCCTARASPAYERDQPRSLVAAEVDASASGEAGGILVDSCDDRGRAQEAAWRCGADPSSSRSAQRARQQRASQRRSG